ncbi:hypothetical protein FXF51_24375 [Nonomuraea sp. PA05]|nr:hypothetical protein FXF51_24375 [Nonomuraea sp. PA05]
MRAFSGSSRLEEAERRLRAWLGWVEDVAGLLGRAAALRESVGAPLPRGERGDVGRVTAALRGRAVPAGCPRPMTASSWESPEPSPKPKNTTDFRTSRDCPGESGQCL